MGEAGDGVKDCKRAVKGSSLSRRVLPRPIKLKIPASTARQAIAAGIVAHLLPSPRGTCLSLASARFTDRFRVRPARARSAIVHGLVTSIMLSSAFLSMSLL